jgi:hypothetical protein
MARPKGTKYIETPEKESGQPKTFKDPKEIKDLWLEFKALRDKTPYIQQVANNKGVHEIECRKPYTKQGFMAFIYNKMGKHIHQYLDNDGGNYDEYLGVVTHIRNEWEDDQISGTLSGVYKAPNLTARLNNLVDNNVTTIREQQLFPDENV